LRYLAIDLGDKRTGIAIGDDTSGIITPHEVLNVPIKPTPDRLLSAIAKCIDEFGPDALVLGLPLNMDGSESAQCKSVRVFGEALQTHTGLTMHYQDERLTSVDAEWSLDGSGKTHGQKKALRDALAAAVILRDFLGK
jgi:putative Holliday junction resolvase